MGALRNAYWSTGAYPHSGTGYSILGAYNNASGTEYPVRVQFRATTDFTLATSFRIDDVSLM